MKKPDSSQSFPPVRSFRSPPFGSVELPPPPAHIENFDLEIGAGTGLHAVSYSFANPGRYLVALERTQERFNKFDRRIQKYGSIPNLLHLRADAQWWVAKHLNTEPQIERVFLLYPNPYLKISQASHRWHRSPFMGLLLESMKPGACLTLTTNIEDYYLEAMNYFKNYWGLKTQGRSLPADLKPRTHFEKKYLESGQTCYEIEAFKISV